MGFKIRTLSLPKPRTQEDLLIIHHSPLNRFSWTELKEATDNFSNKNVIGKGGFGKVYRGQLSDGSVVAIKRSKERTPERDLQFQAEVEIGGNQVLSRHKNMLGLRGYCMTRNERLLVYPFLVNGSVDSLIRERRPSAPPALYWDGRKRIAVGVAKGLAHLHSGSSFAVIHRDVKAANILLDDQLEAVLCDFGLAKVVMRNSKDEPMPSASGWLQRTVEEEEEEEDSIDEELDRDMHCFPIRNASCFDFKLEEDFTNGEGEKQACTWSCWLFTRMDDKFDIAPIVRGHQQSTKSSGTELQANNGDHLIEVTTTVRGTKGHIAPEYHATGKCSIKNDVFAYGIMLLELITGQRAFDKARGGNGMLLDWVKGFVEEGNNLDLVLDSNLRGCYLPVEMKELLELALLCTTSCPADRPDMSEVIEMLQNIVSGGLSAQTISLPRLKLATDNFSNKNLIGRSGFSNLYRGCLEEDGSVVLVKRLIITSKPYMMQLQAEVKLGGMSEHPNVLKLSGYCFTGTESLLVYPLLDRRSLEWHFGPEGNLPLDWQVRMRIAFGVAKGLAHLHHDCGTIHGNVKPSSILLDDDFNPVLCNFRTPAGFIDSNISSQLLNSDVYWYGVILLVLISGQNVTRLNAKAAICISHNSLGLHNWLKGKLRHHHVHLVVDTQIVSPEEWYNNTMDIKDEIEQLFQVILLCTQPSPTDRPHMWEVIQMLQGICEGDLKVCFAFDRAHLFLFEEHTRFNELDQENQLKSTRTIPEQDAKRSTAFAVKPAYSSKGITISDNVQELNIQDIRNFFLSEVVANALPTKSKLFRTGKSVDPLCPLCKEYEEDNWHIFFECDIAKQAWLVAVGVRIDMLGFGSVKQAVDMILKPNGAAGVDILPPDVEPSHFSDKGVAVMYSIWTHRNKVCFDKAAPNVMDIVYASQSLVPHEKWQENQHFENQHEMPQAEDDSYHRTYDYDSDITADQLSGPR